MEKAAFTKRKTIEFARQNGAWAILFLYAIILIYGTYEGWPSPHLILLSFLTIFALVGWHSYLSAHVKSSKAGWFTPQERDKTFIENALTEPNLIHSVLSGLQAQYNQNIELNIYPLMETKKPQAISVPRLIDLIIRNDITYLVQPVVTLPQKKPAFLECIPCVLGPDNKLLDLRTLVAQRRSPKILQSILSAVLLRTLQYVRITHSAKPYMNFICTISAHTLSDKGFLDKLIILLKSQFFPLNNLVLKINKVTQPTILSGSDWLLRRGVRIMTEINSPTKLKSTSPVSPNQVFSLSFSALKEWEKKLTKQKKEKDLKVISGNQRTVLVYNVSKQRDLSQLPSLPFDYAQGEAIGIPKLVEKIQI